ncbi:hypothetical protein ACIQD3_23760 [Peribacillus loiseleuriae]|uniref:hypothetical protein n=1 Tax=Peribacillus loiseleuriae TaxID=1679170 RepID=UPI00380BFD2C
MNQDLRIKIKSARLYYFEIANQMQIHENSLYRLLRGNLTVEKRTEILNAIEALKAEHAKKLLGD